MQEIVTNMYAQIYCDRVLDVALGEIDHVDVIAHALARAG